MSSYAGRDIDLLIAQTDDGEGQVGFRIGNPSKATAGIQKLAQQFAFILLTRKGTVLHHPTVGTRFIDVAAVTQVESELQAALNEAVTDAQQQVRQASTEETPDDERLESVELLKFDLTDGKLTVTLKINSRSGASRVYLLPTIFVTY